jgi:hypothetical protein
LEIKTFQIMLLLGFQPSKTFRIIAFGEKVLLEAGFAIKYSSHGGVASKFQHIVASSATEAIFMENLQLFL